MKKLIYLTFVVATAIAFVGTLTTKTYSAAWEFIGSESPAGCVYAVVPVSLSVEVTPRGGGGSMSFQTIMGTEVHCDGWSGWCNGTGCRGNL